MAGYIKLHRKITEWGWYKDSNTVRVFLHLLLNATHKPCKYMGYELNTGDCIFGRSAFASDLCLSERAVRTAINHLKSTSEVTIKTTNKFSIITLVNYSKYQVLDCSIDQQNDQQSDQRVTNKRPTTDHIQEDKNIRNKESIIAPSDTHSMPNETPIVTIQLNDGTEYPIYRKQVDEFKEIYPSVNVEQQLRSMKGWALSNPTKRKTSRGIMKFINNWLSREQDKAPAPKSNNPYEGMRQL